MIPVTAFLVIPPPYLSLLRPPVHHHQPCPPPCHRPHTQILLRSAHLNSFNLPKHVKSGKKSFADSLASEVSFSSNRCGPCGILACPLESSAAEARGGDAQVCRLPAFHPTSACSLVHVRKRSEKSQGKDGGREQAFVLQGSRSQAPEGTGTLVCLRFAPYASPGPWLKTGRRSKVVPVRSAGLRRARTHCCLSVRLSPVSALGL